MISAHAFGEKANSVPKFQYLDVRVVREYVAQKGNDPTSNNFSIASVLSTAPSTKSFRRLMGTVPADSISQLVNVLCPNCVDFAVSLSMFRF